MSNLSRAYVFAVALLFLFSGTAYAVNGINSEQSVDLPIGAGGNVVMNVGAGEHVPAGDVEFKGNVGIGTATPQAKLDVAGSAKISEATTINGILTLTADRSCYRVIVTQGQHSIMCPRGMYQAGIYYENDEWTNALDNHIYPEVPAIECCTLGY